MKFDYSKRWVRFARRIWIISNPGIAYRIAMFRYILTQLQPVPKRMLDVGCSVGDMLVEFRKICPSSECVALDINPLSCKCVIERFERFQDSNISVVCSPLEQAKQLGKFSFVWCSHVIEHILDWKQSVRSLLQTVAKDGILVINVPYDSQRKRVNPDLDPDGHYWSGFSAHDFEPLLKNAGFRYQQLPIYMPWPLWMAHKLFYVSKKLGNWALCLILPVLIPLNLVGIMIGHPGKKSTGLTMICQKTD